MGERTRTSLEPHSNLTRTATERLCELLDERGVGWSGFWVKDMPATQFRFGGMGWTATEHKSGKLYLTSTNLTPEQAIGATLGRGTCHMTMRENIRGYAYLDTYECSECGEQVERGTVMGVSEPPRFCCGCGRKVVDDGKTA